MLKRISDEEVMRQGKEILNQLKKNPLYGMWGINEVLYVPKQIEGIWTTALEMRIDTTKYPGNGMVRITYIPGEDAYKVEAGMIGEELQEADNYVYIFGLHNTIDDMI